MKKPLMIFVFFVFFTVSAACAVPVETRWSADPTITSVAASSLNLTDRVATLVSTQLAGTSIPSATPTGEATVVSGAEAAAQETPQAAPEATKRAVPAGVVNIMVLGSDWRASSGHRTDAIMLVSVNTVKQTVSAVSFPRDLYIPVPGWETTRINTVEPHGGFELLADTMEQNFGVRPSYYIMTDFKGFTGIIDSLGGVDVYAGSKLTDKCDLPQADGSGKCTIQPGLTSMNGATALWYIRSRYTSNDLDRQRREQEVLMGMFVKIMSLNGVENLPKFFTRFQSSVKTNLTVQAMTPLLPTAGRVFADRKQIQRYWLSVKEAKPIVTQSGAQVLQPDYERIGKIMDEAVFNQ